MDFQVPNTLAEQIADYLAERIMTGQIAPGQRIQEATLAQELTVSRASVKEALYTLERWHLVEITPRRGASASRLDADHAEELYDVYMHLLVMLAVRLCERWRDEHRPGLLETVARATERMRTSDDIKAVVDASFEVMDACSQVVDNPYLSEALSNFRPAVSRAYYLGADAYRDGLAVTRRFFTELPEAVLARDTQRAEALIRGFADHQKSLIRQALD
ncbi:GntR family transcriptional regulator [Marinobacter sp. C2H3]|uniref:GntR family transcriptional regulator n=1 Tax=Marinobacter sp. C2H3 TaxID=3119003 RepID=UPI00300ED851